MGTPSLFDDHPINPRPAFAVELGRRLSALAAREVYIGTSSWKYEGWLGQIYSAERYATRGRFSKQKFDSTCLAEYAETFPIVCGDFSFYQFPTVEYWSRLFTGSPRELKFGFKVPEMITVSQWPAHARYGARGGQMNETYLDADVFDRAFARALEPYRERVGVLIFEFGTMAQRLDEFTPQLENFLSRLPKGFRYAVEIRNRDFLDPLYFDTLRRHNVAHVFNAWARMPELKTQMAIPEAYTADFTVSRALLRHGRSYEQAVKKFEPYKEIQEPNPAARESLKELIRRAQEMKQTTFVFVNNRLEGNAPSTIAAVTSDEP